MCTSKYATVKKKNVLIMYKYIMSIYKYNSVYIMIIYRNLFY